MPYSAIEWPRVTKSTGKYRKVPKSTDKCRKVPKIIWQLKRRILNRFSFFEQVEKKDDSKEEAAFILILSSLKTTLTPYWPYTTCSRLETWDLNDSLVMDIWLDWKTSKQNKKFEHWKLPFSLIESKSLTFSKSILRLFLEIGNIQHLQGKNRIFSWIMDKKVYWGLSSGPETWFVYIFYYTHCHKKSFLDKFSNKLCSNKGTVHLI